jgi:hypothetical protein
MFQFLIVCWTLNYTAIIRVRLGLQFKNSFGKKCDLKRLLKVQLSVTVFKIMNFNLKMHIFLCFEIANFNKCTPKQYIFCDLL